MATNVWILEKWGTRNVTDAIEPDILKEIVVSPNETFLNATGMEKEEVEKVKVTKAKVPVQEMLRKKSVHVTTVVKKDTMLKNAVDQRRRLLQLEMMELVHLVVQKVKTFL